MQRRLIHARMILLMLWSALLPVWAAAGKGDLVFSASPQWQYHLDGIVGTRLKANVDNWLLPAPQSNPGLLEMFRVRDRQPTPELVPWAGEFVGKYLISAIQALRLTENPALRATVTQTVADLIATQAEDGYLGPFPKAVRLKSNWDLWGHYHALLALLMWFDVTGDAHALATARRAADLVCDTFLQTGMRVADAGSAEMNMAIIHALGRLYRVTHEPRYLQMAREIEKDWERAGDYLRSGLAGIEFFQTPRPRWESLHDLQGLVELYRITGEEQYAQAFTHHWRSILRWDRRNTGGFSSGEQATGDPYAPTAIETCCTVAWSALTVDQLQLSGDSQAADELELSLFNAVLGAQHPSGRWCTYNTPMDGAREASAHTIVFQSRAGTPELNCCSVNGPRGIGLLSEWAVLAGTDALVINYYGPGTFQGKLPDNTPVALNWTTDYPRSGKIGLRVEPLAPRRFRLLLRIPGWSQQSSVALNGKALEHVNPGRYLELNRRWEPGDRIAMELDMRLRAVPGTRDALGRVSVYRGPLLLAYDQALNDYDELSLPALDLKRLSEAKELSPPKRGDKDSLAPNLVLDLPATEGWKVRVCDFASAGVHGTRYRSWLPVSSALPPPVTTRMPLDGARVSPGNVLFRWTGPKQAGTEVAEYQLYISSNLDFSVPAISFKELRSNRLVLRPEQMQVLAPGRSYYWKVVSIISNGRTESSGPPAHFVIDRSLASTPETQESFEPGDELVFATLAGQADATGAHPQSASFTPAAGLSSRPTQAVETDGQKDRIIYRLSEFPDEDYTALVWVTWKSLPPGHLGQICSAWAGSMDDPLRLCVQDGKVYARLEAGQGYSTSGFAAAPDQWHHLAVVKRWTSLILYVDGERRGQTVVPLFLQTKAKDIALGGNPHFEGNEFLAGRFARFSLRGHALSAEEIKAAAAVLPE